MHFIAFNQARSRALAHLASSSRSLPRLSVACSRYILNSTDEGFPQCNRSYTSSAVVLEEDAAIKKVNPGEDYNNRRARYKRQVTVLRKEYAAESKAQVAFDKAEKDAARQEISRQKIERQRVKNIRSAQNAVLQKEAKEQRHIEWQKELLVEQQKREAKKVLFAKARQLVVNELEEEAPLWLTTSEEVDAAFTKDAEQRLWALPNSVLGVPNPTDDADFWRYESHTWHMDRTYPTRAEILLEDMEEMIYIEANTDENVWTVDERTKRKELDEKAKLRAMVREEGRRVLLQKQRELLQDSFTTNKGDLPKSSPVPNVRILANTEAMEIEGSKVLLNDPTKFFEFEQNTLASSKADGKSTERDNAKYYGPTLGIPIGLKDPIRSPYDQNRPYPIMIGKMPKPDLRTEKEKKKEEREQAMWAAAQGGTDSEKAQSEIEFLADDNFDTGEQLDYDKLALEYDSDDEKWMEGLDPEKDADIINTPSTERYSDEDIDFVIANLEKKAKHVEEELHYEMETRRQNLLANTIKDGDNELVDELEGVLGESVTQSEGVDEKGEKFIQYERGGEEVDLRALGVDVDNAEEVMSELSEEQLLALFSLDGLDTLNMTTDEIRDALKIVPGLTEEQVTNIVNIEQSLAQNEKYKSAVGMNEGSDKGSEKDKV